MTIGDNDMTKCHVCGIYNCVKNHMDNYTLANTNCIVKNNLHVDANTFVSSYHGSSIVVKEHPTNISDRMSVDDAYKGVLSDFPFMPTIEVPKEWANSSINYKYEEDDLLKEIQEYIDATYTQHYSGRYQATDMIIDAGHGDGFCIGNILKYGKRYGKKSGHNRKDLMKIIHYAIIALHVHNLEHKDEE